MGSIRIISPKSFIDNQNKGFQKKIRENNKKTKSELLKKEILKYSKQNSENKVTLAPRTGDDKDDSDEFFCKYGYSWDYVFVLPVPGTVKKGNNVLTGKTNIETISLYNIDKIEKEKNTEKYTDRDYNGGNSEIIHDVSPIKGIQLHETKDRNGLFLFENPMKEKVSGQRDGFGVIDVRTSIVLLPCDKSFSQIFLF